MDNTPMMLLTGAAALALVWALLHNERKLAELDAKEHARRMRPRTVETLEPLDDDYAADQLRWSCGDMAAA